MTIKKSDRKRFWIWAIAFVLGCALIGWSWAFFSEKTFGAEPVSASRGVAGTWVPTCGQNVECIDDRARRIARKFRAGDVRKDHGWRPRNAFRAPVKARRVWVRKIARYLDNHPGKWRTISAEYRAASCYPASTCYAKELYEDSRARSNCVSAGYPAATGGTCDREWRNGPGLTLEQIQKGGAVALCGGGVVIGVVTSTASMGTTAFVAGWGAAACGWAAWMGMD